jgi:sporulation protein YlmC with PRC-barrel domain
MRGTGITAADRPQAGRSDRIGSVEVDDIVGKNVLNQSDDKIGEVQEIVRDQQRQDLHAVVSVGGFLGMGEKEVTIPLKDLQVRDDEIRAPQFATTEDQLRALPEYDESLYQELDDDQRIDYAEFAAFESDDD